ncbi:MAG TPA: tetratricopeptide repeat protein [Verrucomicrobiae bacterium]|nr:tetratricopeptide repeat protein [Verrucomicrobiae bacterium]
MKRGWPYLLVVCGLVIGAYAYLSQSGLLELLSPSRADTYYNLLVRGFRAGHLSLDKEVPPGLTQLSDPYDPAANATYRLLPYRFHDLSYYHGRLYLYHGVTPAVMLFWPFVALTGRYLWHREAVAIFCAVGFLTNAGLLYALWRRYFGDVSIWVVETCILALGLATGVPVVLSQADVYQVPICCAYMLAMVTLAAMWSALHEPKRCGRWLVVASLAYGLAVGARPSLVLGAVILLVPVVRALVERRRIWLLLVTAATPMLVIGLGVMIYNARRFGSPFEFGVSYLLSGDRPSGSVEDFHASYLLFNLRMYFLKSVGWSARFPFVQRMAAPLPPAGHGNVEAPLGVLANMPFVWLALAAPLACLHRTADASAVLRWFLAAVTLFFGIEALTIGMFYYTSVRYEVEFVPALVLLAATGVLGLERALADRTVLRFVVRGAWGALLVFSVAFNLLSSVEYHAEAHHIAGVTFFQAGNVSEAIQEYKQALRLYPNYAKAHLNLGIALAQMGRTQEAVEQYEMALRINPDYAKARDALARLKAKQP